MNTIRDLLYRRTPVWLRPLVGLVMILVGTFTAPVWMPILIGWRIWEMWIGEPARREEYNRSMYAPQQAVPRQKK